MGSKRLFTELVLYYNMIKNMIYSVYVCKSDMSGLYYMPLCRMCIILISLIGKNILLISFEKITINSEMKSYIQL